MSPRQPPASRPLPSRFTGPGESPGFLLWKVSNAWQRAQRTALEPFELTHTQFVLLASVTWFGATEVLTQARLSELSGVDPMTTSQIVRTLEERSLMARIPHPRDPRAKALRARRAGQELAGRAVLAVEAADRAFFAPIGRDAARLVQLFRSLAGLEGYERAGTRSSRTGSRSLGTDAIRTSSRRRGTPGSRS